MSQKIQCEQCGGEEFNLEDGYYFCQECHMQSQNVQERVMDDYIGNLKVTTTKMSQPIEEGEAHETHSRAIISSWEILNHILKGLVDELILLGAPKTLKNVCLQLWVNYLKKMEVAFTSTKVKKKPKLGAFPRKRDANLFYKVNYSLNIRRYQTSEGNKKTRSKNSRSDVTSHDTSARSKKLRLSRSKKSVAQAEYDESGLESSVNMSSANESDTSMYASSGEERLRHSRQAKKELKEFQKKLEVHEDKAKLYSEMVNHFSSSIQYTRQLHIIAILRIALLLCDCDIHLGDLRRWTDEGYLSLERSRKLLPSTVTLSLGQSMILTMFPTDIITISNATRSMAKLLGVQEDFFSPSKIVLKLVQRYCNMLLLPDCIVAGVSRLLKVRPVNVSIFTYNSNFEGRAMALILFSLKILIGLDDVTEYNYVPRKGVDGVVWDEWVKQRERRTAEKALEHHPTMVRNYPKSYVNRGHALLSHWDTAAYFKRSHAHGKRELFKDPLLKTLKPFVCKLPEPSWRPGFAISEKNEGSLLAVLSETNEDCFSDVKKLVTIMKIVPLNVKRKVRYRKPLKVKVLKDDTVDKSEKPKKDQALKTSEVNIDDDDFKIWFFHSYHLLKPSRFEDLAAEMLPSSFLWILREMSDLIYQSPHHIYRELVRVEKTYTLRRLRYKW